MGGLTKLTVIVRDYNTKRGVQGAFIDFEGYTAITDHDGQAILTVPAKTYRLRIMHRSYTPYTSLLTVSYDGTVGPIDLIPAVTIL